MSQVPLNSSSPHYTFLPHCILKVAAPEQSDTLVLHVTPSNAGQNDRNPNKRDMKKRDFEQTRKSIDLKCYMPQSYP